MNHSEKENIVSDQKQRSQAKNQAPAHNFICGGPTKVVFEKPPPNLNQVECVTFHHDSFKMLFAPGDELQLHGLYKLPEPIEHK